MSGLAAVVFAVAALTMSPVSAQDHHETLRIEIPWARATPPGVKNGAVYMSVANRGATADRLIAAASPIAGKADLHTHIKEGDIMRMRRIDGLAVPPGATAVLEPGGYHIMLMGLKKPLTRGDRFPLTVTFEKAGTVTVEVTVGKTGATTPESPASRHHGH
ncbi:MAG: copper chaperone PCu(A)C [Rhodospirillales bacterium]